MYGRVCDNKVIFAVLDVSSLPLQICQTSMEVFFTLIFAVLLVGTTFITRPSTYLRCKVQLPTSDSTEITASGPKITLGDPATLDAP